MILTNPDINDPPEYLQPEGKARWIEARDVLIERGMWSSHWCMALEQLCVLYQTLADIDHSIAEASAAGEFGMMLPTGRGQSQGVTCLKVNPLMDHRLKVFDKIRAYLIEFGLTPCSSEKVIGEGTNNQVTKAESVISVRPRISQVA